MSYFVTAIGTDSGKTVFSAILTEALKADYWKPVQAGEPRDADMVKSLLSNEDSRVLPESYILKTPASPHAAAKIDGVTIKVSDFELPQSSNLVVEGAGGLMVPLNDEEYVIDLAAHLKLPVILVSNLYLGSINHSLLSIDYLVRNDITVKGLVFNGPGNPESERIILSKAPWPLLLKIDQEKTINKDMVRRYAERLSI
jgi:dethiobiotin synthetase